MTTEEPPGPPERIVKEAARLGHDIEWDDPAPIRSVRRWTCTRCRESVWCDAHDPDDPNGHRGGVLDLYCRGKPLGPKSPPYAWASGRKAFGPPP